MNITLSHKQIVVSFQYFRDGSDRPTIHILSDSLP